MDGFLLDTGVLSTMFDPTRTSHKTVRAYVESLAGPKFVSVISVAELRFGIELAAGSVPAFRAPLEAVLSRVKAYVEPIPISKHTAEEYGYLKSALAHKILKNALKKDRRPRWVEEWTDRATGQKLQADENDLWLCAQALER